MEAPQRTACPDQSSRSTGSQKCTIGNVSPETRAVLSQSVQDGVRDVGTTRHAQRLQAVAAPADRDESLVCDLLLAPPQQRRGNHVSAAAFTPSTPFGDFLRSNCRSAIVTLVLKGAPARWRWLLSASTATPPTPTSRLRLEPPFTNRQAGNIGLV